MKRYLLTQNNKSSKLGKEIQILQRIIDY